jgi:hypothetical protein
MANGNMFNIEVDLSAFSSLRDDILPDFGILQQGVVEASRFVRDTWIAAVTGTMLPGMRNAVNDDAYAKSLSTGESLSFPEPFYGLVMPVGIDDAIDKIENGTDPYDMKQALLNGPKSKPLKDGTGRYNTVPFRHYTPTSNSPISIGMKMPNDVYKEAKQLQRATQMPNGSIQWGMSLDWDKDKRTSFTGYEHKNDIYHGMYRVGYDKHTQYVTFRRVSTPRTKTFVRGPRKGETIRLGSAPNSWWNPGSSANPVIEAVYNYCMPQVEESLMKIADKAFGLS